MWLYETFPFRRLVAARTLAPTNRWMCPAGGGVSKRRGPVLSVGALPEPMREHFAQVASDGGLALQVAVFIARYRKQHRRGPTFAELFDSIPEARQRPGADWPCDSRANYAYRHHLAVHWRRLGWIRWGWQARSLATGERFRAASREHALRRPAPPPESELG